MHQGLQAGGFEFVIPERRQQKRIDVANDVVVGPIQPRQLLGRQIGRKHAVHPARVQVGNDFSAGIACLQPDRFEQAGNRAGGAHGRADEDMGRGDCIEQPRAVMALARAHRNAEVPTIVLEGLAKRQIRDQSIESVLEGACSMDSP